jgi:hypothetical protein
VDDLVPPVAVPLMNVLLLPTGRTNVDEWEPI